MAKENNIIKKWLDRLQDESWNLELIISGFSIFGLFKAKTFLETQNLLFEANDIVADTLIAWFHVLLLLVYASVLISIVFLLVHVFLRGLWIGAIGIRSVSGEIDFEKLNYNASVTNYLKKKLGSFDDYILKLEKASSLIFGYTFLLILVLCSVFLYFLFVWVVSKILGTLFGNTNVWWISDWVFPLFAILFALIIIIDFFTGGVLKKIKSKIFIKPYIFINRIITWITLSFLWKPLYFNLVDRNKTKWLIYLVIPIFLLLFIVDTIEYNAYSIFPGIFHSDENSKFMSVEYKEKARYSFQTRFYDNLRKNNEVIQVMSLPTNKMKTKYIELFVKLSNKDEKRILKNDSTIKHIAIKGFSSYFFKKSPYEKELLSRTKAVSEKNIEFYVNEQKLFRENLGKILLSAKIVYTVRINGKLINSDSVEILFHQHLNKNEEGFLFLFNAENIEKGINQLTLEKHIYDKDKNEILDFTIPFIYAGD